MERLRYYCKGQGCTEVKKLLVEIRTRYNIPHEVLDLSSNGAYDEEREKQVYETEFKPRAKILKKRTGKPITKELRSRRARHYFVSIPGTVVVIKDEKVEWFAVGDREIIDFLKMLLIKGHALLEERCQ